MAILPGMCSNNDAPHLMNLSHAAKQNNYLAVVINYRGASGVPLTVSQILLMN